MFKANAFKYVLKMNFKNFKFFLLINQYLNPWASFERNGAHSIQKKNAWKQQNIIHTCFEHAKGLLKHHQFASSFEHWNLVHIMVPKKEKKINNPIYDGPHVIFQKYKVIVLIKHYPHTMWLLLLCLHLSRIQIC
jgi:hypothetical protein